MITTSDFLWHTYNSNTNDCPQASSTHTWAQHCVRAARTRCICQAPASASRRTCSQRLRAWFRWLCRCSWWVYTLLSLTAYKEYIYIYIYIYIYTHTRCSWWVYTTSTLIDSHKTAFNGFNYYTDFDDYIDAPGECIHYLHTFCSVEATQRIHVHTWWHFLISLTNIRLFFSFLQCGDDATAKSSSAVMWSRLSEWECW